MDRRRFFRSGAALGIAGVGATTLPGIPLLGLRSPRVQDDGSIRMNANENPLGIAPVAREAVVEAIEVGNRYPSAQAAVLHTRMAAHLGVDEDQLVWGAGSTEILRMIVQAFSSPRATLVLAEPTFEDVPGYGGNFAYEPVTVPLTADFQHDLTAMRERAESSGRPAVVYLCNPNNPTGTITASRDVDAWIADAPEHVLFLVDEAYFEYVRDPSYDSALKWIDERPNVIVARTFSKIYGMAGLRLGYACAHRDTVTRLKDAATRNNTNQLAMAAASASLDDPDLIARSRAVNDRAKAVTTATLDELGLDYLPTHTNFVMHRIRGDLDSYIERMAERGLLVGRKFPPMLGYNRLSFSLPEHMELWAETLRDFRSRGWV